MGIYKFSRAARCCLTCKHGLICRQRTAVR